MGMLPDNHADEASEGGSDWLIRAFTQEDLPGIAALYDVADRADHLYKLASEEDIRATFGDVPSEAATRVIVVEDTVRRSPGQADLVGVGRVSAHVHGSNRERVYQVMIRVHPSARPQGLQHVIAHRLVEIARQMERHPSTQPVEKVRILTYVFDSQTSSVEAWEKSGLRRVRTGWTMERRLSEPIEIAPAPSGITFRTYRCPEDNRPALDAFNSALADYFDFHPISQASWDREMAAPYSRPDLSWLALSEGPPDRVIGVAGCQVDESENRKAGRLEGWVEGIGVVPALRHKGVGKALLSRCLQSFRDEGLEYALADVDSESVPAVALFRRAGFSVRCALLQYERAL